MKLHHVQLSCPPGGEDDARAFYAETLELVEVAKPPALAARGGAWFRSPDGLVEVHVGVEQDFRPARKAHPAFLVDDLDRIAGRLERAGYAIERDELFPGFDRIYTADGAGNRIEIMRPASA
jgi:catechol 2,3-dioxygenase-like lactoylglutathione lyase family enzyme